MKCLLSTGVQMAKQSRVEAKTELLNCGNIEKRDVLP